MKLIRTLPETVKTIHFVGIGGIGMSGIAEILHGLGYSVQGSDASDNANVKRLREKGMKVFVGHEGDNIKGADVVVISSAIKADNPEWLAARAAHVPCVHRAEMLAELMRFQQSVAVGGTHGKTTTTSMVYTLLQAGGIEPSVINGGILNALGSNARIGSGEWLVVESDESDGSFRKLRPTIAIITNIEAEHMEFYGTMDVLRQAFVDFALSVPFYGLVIVCADDPEVRNLLPRLETRRVRTYGTTPDVDYQAVNIETSGMRSKFDLRIRSLDGQVTEYKNLHVNVPGRHNVLNALAALAAADEVGIDRAKAQQALGAFVGVKRRFTVVGEVNGVTVVDDYGHHPTEIAATLKSARGVFHNGRVFAVIQPHRYSRLKDHFSGFAQVASLADTVLVAPVYSAGEAPLPGITHEALADEMRRQGHKDVHLVADAQAVADVLKPRVKSGDGVICLGAGTITQWAAWLAETGLKA